MTAQGDRGYLKTSGDMGVKLVVPESGLGKWKSGGEQFWLVETFTDADWSAQLKANFTVWFLVVQTESTSEGA